MGEYLKSVMTIIVMGPDPVKPLKKHRAVLD
jgi:hypothetical protein